MIKRADWVLLVGALLFDPEAARAVDFRGTTTLTGTQGGVVRMSLPVPATLQFDALGDVVGSGDFVGFALSPDPVVLDSFPPYPPFPRLGTVLVGGIANGDIAYDNFIGQASLPAGEYLLYLLADGSPVQVTLRFSELTGSVVVPAAWPIAYDARYLPSIVTVDEAQTIYSAGASGDLTAPGLGLTLMWIDGQEILDDFYAGNSIVYGHCLYNHQAGDDPPDPTIAYLPGCPWLEQSEYITVVPITQSPGVKGIVLSVLNYLAAGRWGQGLWYATPSLVEEAGAVVFWLSLEAPLNPIAVRETSWGRVKELFREGSTEP